MTNWLLKTFVKNNDDNKDPKVRFACGYLSGIVGTICNLLLVIMKLIVGYILGSVAIIADGFNNLSDGASSIITLLGFKLGRKHADKEHPFGHGRFEYIAGLIIAVIILVVGIELTKSSIDRILNPIIVNYGIVSVIVMILSILIKLWMMKFNYSIGNHIDSSTLKATGIDSRNDVIATFVVLISALVAKSSGLILDGWMGLAVAIFIIYSGVKLIKETLNPLLGEAPNPDFVKYINKKIREYDGVLGTHDLIIHNYGPSFLFASVHVEMPSEIDSVNAHNIIDKIEHYFLKHDNLHLIIHHDPIILKKD